MEQSTTQLTQKGADTKQSVGVCLSLSDGGDVSLF